MEPRAQGRPPWWLQRRAAWLLWLLAGLMFAQGCYKFVSGLHGAWILDADLDMQMRAAEYDLFRAQYYPNHQVEKAPPGVVQRFPEGVRAIHSVYPPYAFPTFAAYFEPGGISQGRVVLLTLWVASLAGMGAMGFHALRDGGPAIACIGALTAFAISGNKSALHLGQFVMPCVGLLMLQLRLIRRGRPIAAGLCWSLAMVKPQVALPFAALFLLRKQWQGLAVGAVVLGLLSWAACAWTDNDLVAVLAQWSGNASKNFATEGFKASPAALADAIGTDRLAVQLSLLAAAAALLCFAAAAVRRLGSDCLLPLAGLASVAGMLCFYHRLYDQIMLLPMLLAVMSLAVRSAHPGAAALAVAALASLLVPIRLYETLPPLVPAAATIWILGGVVPLAAAVLGKRRSPLPSA